MTEPLRKCLPIPLPDQAGVDLEVGEIEKLIPTPGLSPEDRHVHNDRIRNLLPTTSNEALLILHRNHQLSRTELVRRLQRHTPFAPESLSQVISGGADMPNSLPKGDKRIYSLALQNMAEVLLVVEPERAVDTLAQVFPKFSRPNGPVIEYLLRIRPDAVFIAEQLATKLGEEPVLEDIRRRLAHGIASEVRDYVSFFLQNGKV